MDFLNWINGIDFAILDFIQETIRCDFLDYIMAFFSRIGEAGAIWITSAAIMLFFKKTRAMGVTLLFAMSLSFIVGEIGLKNIICRPRPYITNHLMDPLISPPSGYSFPSGHSSSSFAAALVIFVKNKKLGIPALIIASLIAFSRLYNYVHCPTDVLCGALLGIVCAVIVLAVFKRTGLEQGLSGKVKKKV